MTKSTTMTALKAIILEAKEAEDYRELLTLEADFEEIASADNVQYDEDVRALRQRGYDLFTELYREMKNNPKRWSDVVYLFNNKANKVEYVSVKDYKRGFSSSTDLESIEGRTTLEFTDFGAASSNGNYWHIDALNLDTEEIVGHWEIKTEHITKVSRYDDDGMYNDDISWSTVTVKMGTLEITFKF